MYYGWMIVYLCKIKAGILFKKIEAEVVLSAWIYKNKGR